MTDQNQSVPAPKSTNVERWLGRREAFGIIAGRCSAADVMCLREIRNKKLYLDVSKNWDEFCRVQLGGSRRKFDTALRQLDEHGPQFFHATQMLHLTEPEFIALKEHITERGLMIEGEIIGWEPENASRLTEGAGKLKTIAAPQSGKRSDGFEAVLKRFRAANEQLEKTAVVLTENQQRSLGEVLEKLSYLAQRRGIVLRT